MTEPLPLLLGTSNAAKAEKWRRVLGETLHLVMPADLHLSVAVEEGAESTTQNAVSKAVAWCKASGLPTLADDLGLFIDALDGFPGAAMKGWGGNLPDSATEAERMTLVQQTVSGLSDTTCHLETALAVALPSGQVAQLTHRDTGWLDQARTRVEHVYGALLEWVFIFSEYQKSWRDLTIRERAQLDAVLRKDVMELLDRAAPEQPDGGAAHSEQHYTARGEGHGQPGTVFRP